MKSSEKGAPRKKKSLQSSLQSRKRPTLTKTLTKPRKTHSKPQGSVTRLSKFAHSIAARKQRGEPEIFIPGKPSRRSINKFLHSDRSKGNVASLVVQMLRAKDISLLSPRLRDVLAGKSKNVSQRFDFAKLSFNPLGNEAKWNPVNTRMVQLSNGTTSQNKTILYHASTDPALQSAADGSVLRTEGPTWHHTRHGWDYFVRRKRVIAEIQVPTNILVNATKLQNTPPGDIIERIKRAQLKQDMLSTTHKQNKHAALTPSVLTGNRPLITHFATNPIIAPYGIQNGKAYATVIMPPFYAQVVNRNKFTNGAKPDIVRMVFLNFVSPDNRALGKLINPRAANQYLAMMEEANRKENDNLRDKIRQNYVTLINHMAAAPQNLTTEKLANMLKNTEKFDDSTPLSELKQQLPNNLQRMIDIGYTRFGHSYATLSLKHLRGNLRDMLNMRGNAKAFVQKKKEYLFSRND